MSDELLLEQALLASYVQYMEQSGSSTEYVQPREAKLEVTPPASIDTLKKLPILELRAEDLKDPVNRECCVCLDNHEIGEKAVRLPYCGHVFHQECIHDWLQRKCTCAVCRFEYPTDDVEFEQQREERMKCSSPRFSRHQLVRMPFPQLLELIPDERDDADIQEMSQVELVEHLIEIGAVDLINIPEPTMQYSMTELRKMSVFQLRKLMNKEAGVYFEKEVTKKEEMISVFIQSGRLHILEDGTSKAPQSQEDPGTAAEKKRDASIKRTSSRRLRSKIRRLFGPRDSNNANTRNRN